MGAAADAVLSCVADYVLDPEIVEGSIADALAELRPARDAVEAARAKLSIDLRTLEVEITNYVAALATAGEVEALSRALAERERQRLRIVRGWRSSTAAPGSTRRPSSATSGRGSSTGADSCAGRRRSRGRCSRGWSTARSRGRRAATSGATSSPGARSSTRFSRELWLRKVWYRYGDSNPGPVAEKRSRRIGGLRLRRFL